MDMKKSSHTFDARTINSEVLTAKQYLGLCPEQLSQISDTKIVPPKLGSSSFGGVQVTYKLPVYKVG